MVFRQESFFSACNYYIQCVIPSLRRCEGVKTIYFIGRIFESFLTLINYRIKGAHIYSNITIMKRFNWLPQTTLHRTAFWDSTSGVLSLFCKRLYSIICKAPSQKNSQVLPNWIFNSKAYLGFCFFYIFNRSFLSNFCLTNYLSSWAPL